MRLPKFDNTESSVIKWTRYLRKDKALLVCIGSQPYLYLGVPSKAWRQYLKASSKGQAYNQLIKGRFTCLKVLLP